MCGMKITKNIKPEYVDLRGGIAKLLDDGKTKIKSVLLITSRKGSVRANHYHKKDAHYVYMLEGKMEYYEKPAEGVKNKAKMKRVILKAGDMVFTPQMTFHATKFLEDSVFLAFATKSRQQADYEADTIRVELVK